MKLLAILDFETSGVDPTIHRVVEIGVTTWSVVHRCVVRSWSVLMHGPDNESEAINRIPAALLAATDIPGVRDPAVAWRNLRTVIEGVDAVVAFNAPFDRSFVPESFRDSRPWICAMADIEWPRPATSHKLTEIALAHGLGISGAHRALADVELIVRLLERSAELGVDIEAMLTKALRPKKRYRAVVSYDTNMLAKERGFLWDPHKKVWWRAFAPEDVNAMSFPFEVLELAS